jgi:hypothetical protein
MKGAAPRVVDVMGDYREEVVVADVEAGEIKVYSNQALNGNKYPSRWDDRYWRFKSKYKRSFSKIYLMEQK